MKLKISRSDLAVLMGRGGGSAAKGSAIPILKHARLRAAAGTLHVSTCDQDSQAEAFGPAEIEQDGDITVSAVGLKTVVDRLPVGETVTLALDGTDLVVRCGRSRVRLPTLPVDAFPSLDSVPMKGAASFVIPGASLDRLLARVAPIGALGGQATNLNSVYLHVGERADGAPALSAVATNGHILLLVNVDAPDGCDKLPDGGVMLPVESIDALLKLFKAEPEVRVTISANRATFQGGTTSYTTKLVEGRYVDFRRVIPKAAPQAVVLDRESAGGVLALLDGFTSREQGSKVECAAVKGGLALAAAEADAGDGIAVAEAEIEGDLPVFGVSLAYLRTILGAFREDAIRLSVSAPTAPILATADGADTLGVLMPMRVTGRIVREARDVEA